MLLAAVAGVDATLLRLLQRQLVQENLRLSIIDSAWAGRGSYDGCCFGVLLLVIQLITRHRRWCREILAADAVNDDNDESTTTMIIDEANLPACYQVDNDSSKLFLIFPAILKISSLLYIRCADLSLISSFYSYLPVIICYNYDECTVAHFILDNYCIRF